MKTKIHFYILIVTLLSTMNVTAQIPTITITGDNTIDVLTSEDYTATLSSQINATWTFVEWQWSAVYLGANGTINSNVSSTEYVQINCAPPCTTTTNVAHIVWDIDYAPTSNAQVKCKAKFLDDQGVPQYTDEPVFNVTLRGIPSDVFVSGPVEVQKCCTTANKTYILNNYGDGNSFQWAYPTGWTPVGSSSSSTITLTPDATHGGAVRCTTRITTAPSSYHREPSITVTRFDPAIYITANQTEQPCEGEIVSYSVSTPCGIDETTIDWDFPPGWTDIKVDHYHTVSAFVSSTAEEGKLTVTADFFGGCHAQADFGLFPIHQPPIDPTFYNCPYVPLNEMNPYCHNQNDFQLLICGNGTPAPVIDYALVSATNEYPQYYRCSVSSPWRLMHNGAHASSFNNIPAYDIAQGLVIIYLPFYSSSNAGVHAGTFAIQAFNCVGQSHQVALYFHRDADWWCECGYYTECFCKPDHCDMDRKEIKDEELKSDLIVPNPNSGLFSLKLKETISLVCITDITGRVILKSQFDETTPTLNLTDKPDGVYFIRILNSNSSETIKLILQK